MTKRAAVRFRVGEQSDGAPFIVLEPLGGDDLNIFKKAIGFDLRPGTSLDDAQAIAKSLRETLLVISET